jgi:hypothetical protein
MMATQGLQPLRLSKKTVELLEKETKHSVGGFRPPPAFIEEAKGILLTVSSIGLHSRQSCLLIDAGRGWEAIS